MIRIDGVTKRYQDLLAVDKVSLNIEKGKIFGLLGPNGAGKSTLVNMMCGIVGIDKGEITIGTSTIGGDPVGAKRYLGVVPQEIALFDAMSVRQNLSYFGELYGLKGSLLKERIEEALALAELEDKEKVKVKKLSGGMKRRLNIVCSMLHHPQVLVLDEPTVGIDPHSRNHILETVRQLNNEKGMMIIYITHYMEEVEKLCERVAIMDHGQILIEGTIPTIIDSLTQEQVINLTCDALDDQQTSFVKDKSNVLWVKPVDGGVKIGIAKGQDPMMFSMALISEMALQVSGLTFEHPTLEHAFLKLTGHGLRD